MPGPRSSKEAAYVCRVCPEGEVRLCLVFLGRTQLHRQRRRTPVSANPFLPPSPFLSDQVASGYCGRSVSACMEQVSQEPFATVPEEGAFLHEA